MSIQKEIIDARADIRTDQYSMSIGEWISLYRDDELNIHPEFQRYFRWTNEQKSNFIESILIGIPIPPIFVVQNDNGLWDVIDGLQRLSTIMEFIGELKDKDDKQLQPLTLSDTKYLPSLKDKKWAGESDNGNVFTPEMKVSFKRAKLTVSIVLPESGEIAKYELFQRLNIGGTPLTPQEARNCLIIMNDSGFFDWLDSLRNDEHFNSVISLTDKASIEQYDMELVIRYLVFRKMGNDNLIKISDISKFLSDEILKIINDSNYNREEEKSAFKRTFENINNLYGDNAFRRYDHTVQKHKAGFIVSAFEVIALGLGFYGGEFTGSHDDFKGKIRGIYSNSTYNQYSGAGRSTSQRIPRLVKLGREIFQP
ncbi:MAG: DUF262 domain-containing protein [Candidatus Hatepunaea meridiana]|nr:DUF262 domain-containing protein [Candidatus Hatepunaea meridiana]